MSGVRIDVLALSGASSHVSIALTTSVVGLLRLLVLHTVFGARVCLFICGVYDVRPVTFTLLKGNPTASRTHKLIGNMHNRVAENVLGTAGT